MTTTTCQHPSTETSTETETTYEASFSAAIEWARETSAGNYLVRYEDTGMTDLEDPGSRCGFGDDKLAEIGRALGRRGLRLVADDRGLKVVR